LSINLKVIDELLEEYSTPEEILGENGLIKQLTKAVLERALNAEMDHHLRSERQQGQSPLEEPLEAPERAVKGRGRNVRNGRSRKTVRSDHGEMMVEVPRDRNSTFEPVIVPKHQRRLAGLDEKIISLYARGMSDREISAQLVDLYGVEISASLISEVTDAVMDEVTTWQARPLESVYPILYLDAIVIKVRQDKRVVNKSCYLAIGVNCDGHKEALGFWIAESEGAKLWLGILTELRNRGLQDVLIACVDGLRGFPEAIESVFPRARVQTCIVHMVRNSLNYVPWGKRKSVAAALRRIYTSSTLEEAEAQLDAFESEYGHQYAAIVRSWRTNWERIIPIFDYAPEIRRVIYTTNTIESVNSVLRRAIKTKGSFPSDAAATKILYLALMNAMTKWTMPIREWRLTLNQLIILFPDRLPNL
jgi:putative transposase